MLALDHFQLTQLHEHLDPAFGMVLSLTALYIALYENSVVRIDTVYGQLSTKIIQIKMKKRYYLTPVGIHTQTYMYIYKLKRTC